MPVRVTQEAIEVLFSDPLPPGQQVTANPILGLRLPDYSFINNAYTLSLPPTPLVGQALTPDPILAKRLPDYSHIGPYFMRDANIRVTQAGLEVLRIGNPQARVTQAGLEIMLRQMPIGTQYTELGQHPDPRRQFDYSWVPGSVGINESPPPPLQTGPVAGESLTPDPILAKRLPDYSFVGPYFMRDPRARITQMGLEVVQSGVPQARITQMGIEVLVRNLPPGQQHTALGQHPDPRRAFDYSWAMGMPQAAFLTPPPPPPPGQQYTALGQHPDPTKLFNYSWISYTPQTFLNQLAQATAASSGGMSTAQSLAVSAFLAAHGTSAPAMAGSVFITAIAILTATGQQAPSASALLSALSTLQANGSISINTLLTAQAAINATGYQPGSALLSALATITSSDDVQAIASFIATSGAFAIPQGLTVMGATSSLIALGAQQAPMGVSVWALPMTNPSAYFGYSYIAARNVALLTPVVGGGQTFQVVMVM